MRLRLRSSTSCWAGPVLVAAACAGDNTDDPQDTDTDVTSETDAGRDTGGIPDAIEELTAPANGDTDGDGIPDRLDLDSDNDGMPNFWEQTYGLNENDPSDAGNDPDGDWLNNVDEYLNGTDPTQADTDGEGLLDGSEVVFTGTDPANADTDGDGMDDKWEIDNGLKPLTPSGHFDPDDDNLTSLDEFLNGTDPLEPDTDAEDEATVLLPNVLKIHGISPPPR